MRLSPASINGLLARELQRGNLLQREKTDKKTATLSNPKESPLNLA
jgi:hypothetical protein